MLMSGCIVLSSCAFITSKTEQTSFDDAPNRQEKMTISYGFSANDSAKFHMEDYTCDGDDNVGVQSCVSAIPENKYFVRTLANPDYTLNTAVSAKAMPGNGTHFLSILTLGIIPGEEGEYIYTFEPKLINNKTGKETSLSKAEITFSKWWGWFVLPFGTVASDGPMQMAVDKLMPNIYKEASIIAYDSKSKLYTNGTCATTECRLNVIETASSVSGDDLKFVAENAKTLKQFQRAKAKLSGSYDICRVSLRLVINKNNIISKTDNKYWQLIDFYNDNCEQVQKEGFANGAEIGINKERLLKRKGVPTKAYKANKDTEMLTFSKLAGEKVLTETYTLSRGIVVSVKTEK